LSSHLGMLGVDNKTKYVYTMCIKQKT